MANWKFMSLFLFVSMPFPSSIFPVEDDVGHTFTIFCCAISGVLLLLLVLGTIPEYLWAEHWGQC